MLTSYAAYKQNKIIFFSGSGRWQKGRDQESIAGPGISRETIATQNISVGQTHTEVLVLAPRPS